MIIMSSQMYAQVNDTLEHSLSQYDPGFIEHWSALESDGVIVRKDSILINGGKDHVILIPTDLPLNNDVEYHSMREDTVYTLVVKRLNYTNVYFSILGTYNNEIVLGKNDTAVLETSFHLGAEGVYENDSGDMFMMNDYNINDAGDHKLLIPKGTTDVIYYFEPLKHKRLELVFKRK